MQTETKTCQNCNNQFTIEPEDFHFYKKMEVPAPTWCPECRMIRRMMFRNERVLHKHPCNAPGHTEELVSIYSADKPFVVYDQKYWWSDAWDPLEYGQEYDFSKPFFSQFRELMRRVPLLSVSNSNATNSDFCNVADQSKDSYLTSGSYKIERVLYSNRVYNVKDSVDLYVGFRCELCYECISCTNCYRLLYGQDCINCSNSYFLYDCRGCSDCIGCTNLRNRKYCILNQQYSKEEYEKRVKELKLDSRKGLEEMERKFRELYLASLHRYARIYHSSNVTGDNIENAKNCVSVFDITEGLEDSKYVHWGGLQTHNAYDSGPGCGDVAELMYETIDSGLQAANLAFTNVVYGSHDIRYALYCHGSKNLFGCLSLRNKQYCILNRQYSKEEYEALVPKIIEHMAAMPYEDSAGRVHGFGEYFPVDLAPIAYNESIAQDYFPLAKSVALERGYAWHEDEGRNYVVTIPPESLSDSLQVTIDITKEVIGCLHGGQCQDGCTTAFRITSQELSFYKQFNLPLPQLCFSCRHVARLKKRNPMKLWQRTCMCGHKQYPNTASHAHHPEGSCSNSFETTYAPERPEIVYCEQCYQAEVS